MWLSVGCAVRILCISSYLRCFLRNTYRIRAQSTCVKERIIASKNKDKPTEAKKFQLRIKKVYI
jgi:hypothetical protein